MTEENIKDITNDVTEDNKNTAETVDTAKINAVVDGLKTREDIMDVSYGDNGEMNVTPTANFKQFLTILPALNTETTKILDTSLDDDNEAEIKETNKKLSDAKKAEKAITAARRYIKDTFKHNEELALAQFDNALSHAGYRDFAIAVDRIKQRRLDIIAHRKEMRWQELANLFNAEIKNFPLIAKMAPQLTDFNNFKQSHDKLVSGAATRNISDDDRKVVTSTIAHYNEIISTLINQVKTNVLTKASARAILDAYSRNPDDDYFAKQLNYYLVNPKTDQANSDDQLQDAISQLYIYVQSQRQLWDEYNSNDIKVAKEARLEIITALVNSLTDPQSYIYHVTNGNKELTYDLIGYVVSH